MSERDGLLRRLVDGLVAAGESGAGVVRTPKNSIMYQGPGIDGRTLKVWVFPGEQPGGSKIVKSVAWKDEK